jgi:hypothetical protein
MSDINAQAIVFQCDYVDRPAGSDPNATPVFTEEQRRWAPQFQDIHISNVTCRGTHTAIKAAGIAGLDCISDIKISNSTFVYTHNATSIDEQTAKVTVNNVTLQELKNVQ